MKGIDYSQPSIDLATRILLSRDDADTASSVISYSTLDLMTDPFIDNLSHNNDHNHINNNNSDGDHDHQRLHSFQTLYKEKFGLALDKGTFDAICLSSEARDEPIHHPANHDDPPKSTDDSHGQKNSDKLQNVAGKYAQAVSSVLSSNGIFLITSCNWTEQELRNGFHKYFDFHSRVKYPTFKFGGVEGQKVVTVAFTKRM